MIVTFYGDQVWEEYASWDAIRNEGFIPTGMYAYNTDNQLWYQCRFKWEAVALEDVPPMLRSWILILGD